MSSRKATPRATPKTKAPAKAGIPSLPVHDIKGAVVFPMPMQLKTLLGEKRFEELCEDLRSREYTAIGRYPDQIVYIHFSPIVVPMDLVLSLTPPTPEALAAARRKAVRKTVANKR